MDNCYRKNTNIKWKYVRKKLLGDWTHVLEAMLLSARLTETCLSNGRFSAVISGRFGALLGKVIFCEVILVG